MQSRTTIQIEDSLRKELKILAAARDLSYQELLTEMINIFKQIDPLQSIISLPAELTEALKEKMNSTQFTSLSSFISHLLQEAINQYVAQGDMDEEKVKERLRSLGYLD